MSYYFPVLSSGIELKEQLSVVETQATKLKKELDKLLFWEETLEHEKGNYEFESKYKELSNELNKICNNNQD